jgi:hypothetical protein
MPSRLINLNNFKEQANLSFFFFVTKSGHSREYWKRICIIQNAALTSVPYIFTKKTSLTDLDGKVP